MAKIIGAINMTVDGYGDHQIITPGAEIHRHFEALLHEGAAILYGRITYQLMEYWKDILENPVEQTSMNDFAATIHSIPKIVFSSTLKEINWDTATLASTDLKSTVETLKKEPGKKIFVGSRSLIIQLINLGLLDELQLCLHPVLGSKSIPLFDAINRRIVMQLAKTRQLGDAIILYYHPQYS